jgi:magnesium transporter
MTELEATTPDPLCADTAEVRLERRGVVNCACYENGKRVADIRVAEAGAFINRAGTIVWLGLHEPDADLLETVQQQFGLHELIIEEAKKAHPRPKIEVYENLLSIVLRTAQLIAGRIEYGETHLIAGAGFVISIRSGASASYVDVRQRCERNPELLRLGESAIIYAILDFVGDNYFAIIDKITQELGVIEDDIFATMPAIEKIERIYRLRSGLLDMRNAVSPMVEICNQLRRHDFFARTGKIRPYLHDVHDHVTLVSDAIADLRERLTAAFEASLLLASARQNEIVKKLASWAAILGVPTMIAGIYGMNFKSMPELDWIFGYPAVMALMAGTCGYLYYRFRRASWL